MRSLMLTVVLAVSLVANAQEPQPFPQGMSGMFQLTQHQLNEMELDRVMVAIGVFKDGLQELYMPTLAELKTRYRAHYKQELPQHLEEHYPLYLVGHPTPSRAAAFDKMAEIGWGPPMPPVTFGAGMGGYPGMGMPLSGGGGMIMELSDISCLGGMSASCLTAGGGFEELNSCLTEAAKEIQSKDPECANKVRTNVRNFKAAIEQGKYPVAQKSKVQNDSTPPVIRFGARGKS